MTFIRFIVFFVVLCCEYRQYYFDVIYLRAIPSLYTKDAKQVTCRGIANDLAMQPKRLGDATYG